MITTDIARRAILPLALVVGACNALTGPDARNEPALIRIDDEDARVVLPDTATAGATVTLIVTTFGGGCITGPSRSDVYPIKGSGGASVLVRLFNRNSRASSCTLDLRYIDHHVTVPTSAAGTLTIRIQGARQGRDTNWKHVPWAITRTVELR
jgi:hypothetical protein